MKFRHAAKAGKLILIDEGEYSDYGVMGFFVTLRDFTPADELDEFLKENPVQSKRYKFERSAFLAFLIAKGLLLEIEYGNLYMGSYASADCEFSPANEA